MKIIVLEYGGAGRIGISANIRLSVPTSKLGVFCQIGKTLLALSASIGWKVTMASGQPMSMPVFLLLVRTYIESNKISFFNTRCFKLITRTRLNFVEPADVTSKSLATSTKF